MGKRFIPNWRRANSPISTLFSRRSKGNSDRSLIPVGWFDFLARIPAGPSNTEHRTSNNQPAVPSPVGSSTFNVGCSMFGQHFLRRVMGAWWPPRSSKPSSVRFTGRGRFDSCPLRHFECGMRSAECGVRLQQAPMTLDSLCISHSALRIPRFEGKEVVAMSRAQILKLTSLSSCAG